MEYHSYVLKYLISLRVLNLLLFCVTIAESTGTNQRQPDMNAQGPWHIRHHGNTLLTFLAMLAHFL